jgi:hypothetical protein
VDNDAGIVRLRIDGNEYAYAISFFSQEVPWKYGDVVLAQRLGHLVYQAMTERYSNGTRSGG